MSGKTERLVSREECGRVLICSGGQKLSVLAKDILCFEVTRRIVRVRYDAGETFEFSSTLDATESALEGLGFVRAHRSFLVNMSAIERFGATALVLRGGTVIPVGRTYKQRLERELESRAVAVLRCGKDE